jgi:hypothetical protein
MTAKQKAARAKFKAVVAEAKKLRKKNPKLTQAQAVKQAWAIEYSKSGKKKPAKKKVGAIKIVEKGESKKTKPKATYQVKRTAKGTYKGLKKVGAVRKTQDVWEVYGYYPTGKEVVYTASNSNEAKSIVKDYKKNEPYIRFTIAPKRLKKVGAVKKKSASKSSYHKDTKSHNVRISVVSGYKKTMYSLGNVNTKKLLEQMAKESKLKKDVISILVKKAKDYKNNYKSLLKDILYNGLQSGIVSELIYFSDTLKWYKKHQDEIGQLLQDQMESFGVYSPAELFGRKWEGFDPFAKNTSNQNLLAWFSFEETAREIADRLGYEL